MKTIWENLGEQIKTWTGTAAEKAGVITRAAASKAEELSKIGKLKMDIYQLRRERGRIYACLGQIAYHTLEGKSEGTLESQPRVEDLRRRIADLSGKIKEKEGELERASRLEEPVHDAAPRKEKAVPKKEAPAAKPGKEKAVPEKEAPATKPDKEKAVPKKETPTAKPSTAEKGSGGKKTTTAPKKTGPRKTTRGTGTD